MFKIYGYNYHKGWEILNYTKTMEKAVEFIDSMDAEKYQAYMTIEHNPLLDIDMVVDRGYLDRPKKLTR